MNTDQIAAEAAEKVLREALPEEWRGYREPLLIRVSAIIKSAIEKSRQQWVYENSLNRAAHASEQLSTLLSDIRVFLIRYRNGMIEHAEALKLQGRVDLYMSRASQRQTPATDDTKRLDFLEHCEVKETCQVATAVIHGATYREAIDAAMSQTKEK